jgi:hypothetical protein
MWQPLQMRYYSYLSGAIIVTSLALIGAGIGVGISGLIIGGVLCFIVGAMVSFFGGIEQNR